MSPRPPTPPDEFGFWEPRTWGDLAKMLFVLACISCGVLYMGGTHYVLAALVAGSLLCVPYFGRWRTEDSVRRVMLLTFAWPATVLIIWYVVMNEERWRKERIVRDVMES